MPHLRIETNIPRAKIPKEFVCKAGPILARALGKEESYCVASVIPDVIMCFGGSEEPCAIANIMSIGSLGIKQNKLLAEVIFDLVEKELGIAKDRMYLTFEDKPASDVGFKGTTFHGMFDTK